MADDGGTNERALLKRIFEQAIHRRENPLSVREQMQYFVNLADERLKVLERELSNEQQKDKEREKRENLKVEASIMRREALTALEYFEANDIDRAVIALGHMHEHRAKFGLLIIKSAMHREDGSKGGPISKRPRGPFWKLLEAISDNIGTDNQQLVSDWWDQWSSEDAALEADDAVAFTFCTWSDKRGYHFEFGDQSFTKQKRDIQKILSAIRNDKQQLSD